MFCWVTLFLVLRPISFASLDIVPSCTNIIHLPKKKFYNNTFNQQSFGICLILSWNIWTSLEHWQKLHIWNCSMEFERKYCFTILSSCFYSCFSLNSHSLNLLYLFFFWLFCALKSISFLTRACRFKENFLGLSRQLNRPSF